MAQLIVGLTPTLARALASGDETRDTTLLRELELTPQRPRALEEDPEKSEDAEPVVWFSADTDDADDVTTQLLRIPGVEAAYATPSQGPP